MEANVKDLMSIYYQYIEYVNNNLNKLALDNNLICGDMIKKYGIADNRCIGIGWKRVIENRIMELIENLHNENGNLDVNFLKKVVNQLKLEYNINKKDYKIQIEILENLCNCFSGDINILSDKDTLMRLFEFAIDLHIVNDSKIDNENINIKNIILAAKYMRDKGYKFDIINGELEFNKADFLKIHSDIESIIKSLGGINIAKNIFSRELNNIYNSKHKRYIITRRKSSIGHENKLKSMMPYNYILQICMKHLYKTNSLERELTFVEINEKYEELESLSKNFTTCLGLQNHSIFENLSIDFQALPDILNKNVLFDKLFTINQWKPKYVLEIIEHMFFKIYKENRSWSYKLKEYLKVCQIILEYKYCSIINFDEVFKKACIKRNVLEDIFNDISHTLGNVNNEFRCILDKTNFGDRPLIKLNENEYFLLSPLINGFSFYEALYDKFRLVNIQNQKLLNRKQGFLLENFIKYRLDKKNIDYKYGHYNFNCVNNGKNPLECDLILEDDKNILFIEIKKRPLSKKVEQLDDIELLKILGEGIVFSQKQALNHELQLRLKGNIKLFDDEKLSKELSSVEYGKRNIIKISLTFQEYGFLAYKTITEKIMQSLLICEFSANNPNRDQELDNFRKQQKILSSRINELYDGKKIELSTAFHNSIFRSLQQFLYSLDNSSNTSELIYNMCFDRYMGSGEMDFYSELFYILDKLKPLEE
ncbi:hypothetical protein [Clostridium beijerinckii]|uniref:Holliday junction resolvase-like predicted endonuclease n=1 Tax=Clostridium beijerinckii TaxID=1520 RepID=A0AAX0B3L4_CLOBE|nr:hypothetical protein [Clostridium beijerinckii]NRT89474.1 Holliday junction resolvase-like predicted endonuclease [Clostridium beijerinckii]NYC74930.1 Holliday junction resolvase-like predicted endonuclease [Clostridium beijerinckii]